mmetsp:Transcript_16679/g.36173  ORF Transcript_16679/g.36173 Transcript_16679/m.36173 type:complete len:87 (+) Transcript_16679:646-906(+)
MKIYAKSYGYKMSKAAQNCFTLVLSVDYPSLCCIAVHPGFVQTDMTKFKAALTPEQSSGQVLDLAARLTAEDTGKFMDLTGKPLAW